LLFCALSKDFAKDDPCILAGDFNFKPGDAGYELATKGDIPKDHEDFPEPTHPEEQWTPACEYGFESAYLQCTGREPDFTNYAQIREDPVFIECLDYIFHSPSLKVRFPSPSPPLPSFLPSQSLDAPAARSLMLWNAPLH